MTENGRVMLATLAQAGDEQYARLLVAASDGGCRSTRYYVLGACVTVSALVRLGVDTEEHHGD